MSEHHHKFRYLLPPGNNFAFVSKFKAWLVISVLLMAAAVGALFVNKATRGEYMNWTIDFKGGTEIIFAFKDKATRQVRQGRSGARSARRSRRPTRTASRSRTSRRPTTGRERRGRHRPRHRSSAPRASRRSRPSKRRRGDDDFDDDVQGSRGRQGDVVRRSPVRAHEEADQRTRRPCAVFAKHGLELKPWSAEEQTQYTHADEGTGEYNACSRSGASIASTRSCSRTRSPQRRGRRRSRATASAPRPATSCATTRRSRSSTRSS